MLKSILSVLVSIPLCLARGAAAQADWAHPGSDGKLVYKSDARGNRIMDFSSAGYMGGGVALPDVPAKETLKPTGGDDRAAIQAAIDRVSALPLVNGFRGAVALSAGTFRSTGSLQIAASGVVVRGAGPNATDIVGTGGGLFVLSGAGSYAAGKSVNLSDSYIPSGAMTIKVADASGFSVGDEVLITRTATAEWIAYMGMDSLVRNGAPETWIPAGSRITTDRTLVAINGNTLALDGPLTDSFDSKYLGTPVGTVAKYAFAGRIVNCGLEGLKITAPANANPFASVQINAAKDCWVRNVSIQDGVGCFTVGKTVRRVTIASVVINHSVASTNPALPADFDCTGTQILFDRCESHGTGSWCWTTASEGIGPIVILHFKSTQNTGISPHMRWTTGILADADTLPNAPKGTQGIAFRNRGILGSGHGWTTGWSVAWNVVTPYFLVSAAPGTINWAIGGQGAKTSTSDPDGIYDHFDAIVQPPSLYLQQLQERLGAQALANIGYGAPVSIIPRDASGMQSDARPFATLAGHSLLIDLRNDGPLRIECDGLDGSALGSMGLMGHAGRNRVETAALVNGAGPAFFRINAEGRRQSLAMPSR